MQRPLSDDQTCSLRLPPSRRAPTCSPYWTRQRLPFLSRVFVHISNSDGTIHTTNTGILGQLPLGRNFGLRRRVILFSYPFHFSHSLFLLRYILLFLITSPLLFLAYHCRIVPNLGRTRSSSPLVHCLIRALVYLTLGYCSVCTLNSVRRQSDIH